MKAKASNIRLEAASRWCASTIIAPGCEGIRPGSFV